MRRGREIWGNGRAALVVGMTMVTALSGCGQTDFPRNPPRPPVAIQLTGVITATGLTVSPSRIGSGPIVLNISNQDEMSHTVILEKDQVREEVGPINPDDAAKLTSNLTQGRYTLRVGSEQAVAPGDRLEPAVLEVGPRRPTGEDDLLRP